MKRLVQLLLVGASLTIVWLAWRIKAFKGSSNKNADVAIILGAALIDEKPSPVFLERIRHGHALYVQSRVNRVILTGGVGRGCLLAESEAAKELLVGWGVPAGHILIETESRTTLGNLVYASQLMQANELATALIVSDPLHLKRALIMAKDLQLPAYPSATLTSRYQSWHTQITSLCYELIFYLVYVIGSRIWRC